MCRLKPDQLGALPDTKIKPTEAKKRNNVSSHDMYCLETSVWGFLFGYNWQFELNPS